MKVNHKATINGYERPVWFSKDAITNIIALKNIIWQYRVTYNSDEFTFVVHRKATNKKNMEFRMHANGLHCYDPREYITQFAFMETVAGNKKGFTKRQIKDAENAKNLYTTLSYPSVKDYKWVIHSNQIKNCPVTVEDVATASKIWGKNVDALKGKTTRRKPEVVKGDLVKVVVVVVVPVSRPYAVSEL